MLDDNPVLKERLMGIAALGAIGLGGVIAVDLMVTGGFDFAPGRAPRDHAHPGAYVRVVEAAQSFGDGLRSMSWNEPLFLDEGAAAEPLEGGTDGTPPPETFASASNEDLYQRIEALYSEGDATEAAYVEEPSYQDEPAYDGVYADEDEAIADYGYGEKDDASAYGNASPW